MRRVRRQLATSSLWAFGGFSTLALTSVAVNAVLTRTLTPASVGVYFLAASVVYLAATVGRAGLNQAVVRLIAGAESTQGLPAAGLALRTVLRVAALAATAAGVLLAFSLGQLAETVFDSDRLAQLGLLLGCWSFVEALRLVASEALRGFGHIGAATLLGDAGRQVLFGAAVVAAVVSTGELTLNVVVACAVAAGAAVLLVALVLLRRRLRQSAPSADAPSALGTLRLSLPMMVAALSLLAVSQGDVWLAGIFLSDAEVGVYAATARLVLLVVIPLQISSVVLTPIVARLHARGRITELERVARVGAAAAALPTVVIVATLLLAGGPILGLVYGDAYREGARVLAILACGQLVNALVGACGQVLLMTGNQKAMMRVTVAGGALFFLSGAVATSWFGLSGLAVASAVTIGGTNVVLWILVRRRLGVWTHATLDLKGLRKRGLGEAGGDGP